jgi:hypothetical protein
MVVPGAAAGLAAPVLVLSGVMVGLGNAAYNVTQLTLRQVATPDRMLGRVNATMRALFLAPQPAGALLAGVPAAAVGYVPVLLVGGAITTGAAGFLPGRSSDPP